MSQEQIVNGFVIPNCPITHLPMVDPVIDHEGNTYENEAIREWLRSNNTSPITRNPLQESNLIPNRALIEAIEKLTIAISNQSKYSKKNRVTRCFTVPSTITTACSGCGKTMSLSQKYKGNKEPTCYNCRPWNCKTCTFTNVSGVNKCIMCENDR